MIQSPPSKKKKNLREGSILSTDCIIHNFLNKPPTANICKPLNFCQILINTYLCPFPLITSKVSSIPCNTAKLFSSFHFLKKFTFDNSLQILYLLGVFNVLNLKKKPHGKGKYRSMDVMKIGIKRGQQ